MIFLVISIKKLENCFEMNIIPFPLIERTVYHGFSKEV